MCGSMIGFAFNDAAIKYASADIGIYQSIFIRGLFATLIIGTFALFAGAFRNRPNARDHKLIAYRTGFEVIATISFLTALFYLPIANISAILQALPLTVTLAAFLFLGESIGWRRGSAIVIGMIGVLLIIRPGAADFNAYSILGIFAVIAVTGRDIVVRKFSPSVSNLYVSFFTSVVITTLGLTLTLTYEGWAPVTIFEITLLGLAGIMIFAGYYCSVAAMRVGDVGFVTPFRYTVMIWAILLGYVVWGDVPDTLMLIGLAIVIGMGMYTFWRERRVG